MKAHSVAALLFVVLAASFVGAQEPPTLPPPQKEHEWLQKFVGEWTSDAEATIVPGQPALKCTGTISSRSLGGYWIVSDFKSAMLGTSVTAVQTIGFDTKAGKYVGSWIDSMSDHMWRYEGSVDATGKILTLEAEGPNFLADNKLTKFRDSYEFKSDDHMVATSSMMGEDGQWITFMTGNVRRK
jgi:hypothetical protein